MAQSVVQDLMTGELTRITNTPNYDETTIFSPDERLGIVMSPRFSPKTNCALMGLVPRPHGNFVMQGMLNLVYMYSVAGVREFRKGNIGPVLIDINRSMTEPDYRGIALHDPKEDWVYLSPMSWHPSGKKAMWPELLRGTQHSDGGAQRRIQIAELLDYQPGEPAAPVNTPDDIPYASTDSSLLKTRPKAIDGKIAGKHSGYMELRSKGGSITGVATAKSTYVNFSDDGKTFYNGWESTYSSFVENSKYEAELEVTGENQGEIKLRMVFSPTAQIPSLLFEPDSDGRPMSYGYASYNGQVMQVEEMRE